MVALEIGDEAKLLLDDGDVTLDLGHKVRIGNARLEVGSVVDGVPGDEFVTQDAADVMPHMQLWIVDGLRTGQHGTGEQAGDSHRRDEVDEIGCEAEGHPIRLAEVAGGVEHWRQLPRHDIAVAQDELEGVWRALVESQHVHGERGQSQLVGELALEHP